MPDVFRRVLDVRDVEGVPRDEALEWLRLFVVAAYAFLRPEELYGVLVDDIDWHAQVIRVRRTLKIRNGTDKRPKTKRGVRDVPIHANLMPLLRVMAEGRPTNERLLPIASRARSVERNAEVSRAFLRAAGVTDVTMLEGDEDRMPFDFRSWRTTGCTWHAMLGTDSWVLATWAGHKSPETTWSHYAKRGPDTIRLHGEPFPPLPLELLAPARVSDRVSDPDPIEACNSRADQCAGRDLNPPKSRRDPARDDAREHKKIEPPAIDVVTTSAPPPAETSRPDPSRLARVARRVRLLVASASGDVRAELEEIRAELDALVGNEAAVISLRGRR